MPACRWRICTPTGAAGAIAVFQLEGDIDHALGALGLAPMHPGQVRLRSLPGVADVLAARWDAPTLHLMPHAGAAIQRALADLLIARGIASALDDPPHYPEASDALEARMLHALARAASPLAIDLLLDQPRRWLQAFPAGAPRPSLMPADADGMLAPARYLNRLVNPPLIVALGPTNIGKSTLVNALAGRAVSIVADEPGTTRDHVGVTLDLAGLVVRYADTPGLRAGAGDIERQAAEIALSLARSADLVLLCGDAGSPPPSVTGISDSLRIALRSDLGRPLWPFDAALSVRESKGLPELVSMIRERLVPQGVLDSPRPWAFWTALEGSDGAGEADPGRLEQPEPPS